MTLAEIAAGAEKAADALTVALNNQPCDDPDVAEKLRGIVHAVMLAVGALAAGADNDTAEKAAGASDLLLAAMPALEDVAEAMREAAYRRTIAA